jgi:hypothetical protein
MKRTDGTSAWDLPTPGSGHICGMSAGLDGGIGIVVSQSADNGMCASVSGVDVTTGKALWTKEVSTEFDSPDAGAAEYGVTSGIAVVDSDQSGSGTGVIGLDLHTGSVKWRHAAGCDHRPAAFAAGGGQVAVAETCQGQAAIHVLDAATGTPTPGAPTLSLNTAPHPQILSAAPLVFAEDVSAPKTLTFASATRTPVTGLDGIFTSLTDNGPSRTQLAAGAGVLCVGHQPACWTAAGTPVSPRGLPNADAAHHDVYEVAGTGDAAHVITTSAAGHPRASLCRIAADGTVTVEADLSQPVSDYLGKDGYASVFYAYSDAKDLYLVDPHPAGETAVIDVRLG